MKNNSNRFALIMAGGIGSRFWPISTTEHPKQFHDLLDTGKTLLQETFNRLSTCVPKENILIASNSYYKEIILEQLPFINTNQLVLEPIMRNTAPCILYASLKVKAINPDATLIVTPSDHAIIEEEEFSKNASDALDYAASHEDIVTLGIHPNHPNTGFGYIQYKEEKENPIKEVKKFTEKPDLTTAKSFLESGDYLWNAGIFVWHVNTITSAFETHLKEMYTLFQKGEVVWNSTKESSFISENYPKAENISIDFGVLEKAKNIKVLPVHFTWNDLGTWGSLYQKLPKDSNKNAVVGAKVFAKKASNNIIYTQKNKKVIIDGLNDYIVVEKEDVIMIYPKNKEQEIKVLRQEAKDYFEE